MNNLSQQDIILWGMLNNPQKLWWKANDFQHGEYFVGYEASPRMSELAFKYPALIKRGTDGKFRTLSINWENAEEIKQHKDRIQILIDAGK